MGQAPGTRAIAQVWKALKGICTQLKVLKVSEIALLRNAKEKRSAPPRLPVYLTFPDSNVAADAYRGEDPAVFDKVGLIHKLHLIIFLALNTRTKRVIQELIPESR